MHYVTACKIVLGFKLVLVVNLYSEEMQKIKLSVNKLSWSKSALWDVDFKWYTCAGSRQNTDLKRELKLDI